MSEKKQELDHSGWPEHIRKTIRSGDELSVSMTVAQWMKTRKHENPSSDWKPVSHGEDARGAYTIWGRAICGEPEPGD
jgi:hypothetical protein